MRAGLTDAQFRNLRTQGELITNLLIETGTVEGDPNPYVNETAVRAVLKRILPPIAEGARAGRWPPARAHVRAGRAADRRQRRDLRSARRNAAAGHRRPGQASGRALQRAAARVEYLRLTPWRPTASLEEERARALRGEIARGERLNEKRRARRLGDAADAARAAGGRHRHDRKRRRGAHPGGRTRQHDPVRAGRDGRDLPVVAAAGAVHRPPAARLGAGRRQPAPHRRRRGFAAGRLQAQGRNRRARRIRSKP